MVTVGESCNECVDVLVLTLVVVSVVVDALCPVAMNAFVAS